MKYILVRFPVYKSPTDPYIKGIHIRHRMVQENTVKSAREKRLLFVSTWLYWDFDLSSAAAVFSSYAT